MATSPELPVELQERVLAALGFSDAPEPTLESLTSLYAAWCHNVPFDNVRKLIHVAARDPGPLPGNDPVDFFEAWLAWRTGGTCWAGSGALHALLRSLGFSAARGIGTMLVVPDLPPNHGTVVVDFDGRRYLVDTSILHAAPLPLEPDEATGVDHPAWGVACGRRDGRWHVAWRPLHKTDGFECRIETLETDSATCGEYHERTRGWSPFNFELSARLNRDDRVVGAGFGKRVELDAAGRIHTTPLDPPLRRKVLIEELGIGEEIVDRLPADRPTPPPPGSHTAEAG